MIENQLRLRHADFVDFYAIAITMILEEARKRAKSEISEIIRFFNEQSFALHHMCQLDLGTMLAGARIRLSRHHCPRFKIELSARWYSCECILPAQPGLPKLLRDRGC